MTAPAPTVWLMFTPVGFYPIQVTARCTPEIHANLNPQVIRIEDASGAILWERKAQ